MKSKLATLVTECRLRTGTRVSQEKLCHEDCGPTCCYKGLAGNSDADLGLLSNCCLATCCKETAHDKLVELLLVRGPVIFSWAVFGWVDWGVSLIIVAPIGWLLPHGSIKYALSMLSPARIICLLRDECLQSITCKTDGGTESSYYYIISGIVCS